MFVTINDISYSILEFTGFRFISSAEHPIGIEIFYSGGSKIKKYFDTEAERDEFVEALGSSFVKLGSAYYNALLFTAFYKEDVITPTPSYNVIAHYQGSTKLVFKFDTEAEREDFIEELNSIIGKEPDLSNYYTKPETDAKFNQLDITNRLIVEELPTQDISTKTIYMVPKTTSKDNDVYIEYMYINNAWEILGNTSIDLSNYLAKDNTTAFTPSGDYNPATKKYVDDAVGDVDLSNYLAKNNTTAFTPSGDYNPATKKYVDEQVGWYVVDVDKIEKLTTSSTNAEIITAFGGQNNLDALITAIQARKHLLAHNGGEYTNADGQYVSKSMGYIQYLSLHYFDVNKDESFYIMILWSMSAWSVNKIEKGTPTLLNNDQTISGKKTFTTLPESSVAPTTNNQLVNKKYVDDSMSGITHGVKYLQLTRDTDISTLQRGVYYLVKGNYNLTFTYSNMSEGSATYTFTNIPSTGCIFKLINNDAFTVDELIARWNNEITNTVYSVITDGSAVPQLYSTEGVNTTDDQQISGTKTFTDTPVCHSTPTQYYHLVNKSYVDSKTDNLIINLDADIYNDNLEAVSVHFDAEHAIFYYTPRVLSLDGFNIGFVLGFSNIRRDGDSDYIYYDCVQYIDSSTQTVKVKDYRLQYDPTEGMDRPIELWEKDVTSDTWTSVHEY